MANKVTYTTILHQAREELGITTNEYCIADIIYHLSNNPKSKVQGWCFASKKMIGSFIGISKPSAFTIIEKLIVKGIIEKDDETKYLRTTRKWYDIVVLGTLENIGKETLPRVKKTNAGVKKTNASVSKLNSLYYSNKDSNIYKGDTPPEKPKKKKPEKLIYGEFQKVKLTAEEFLKLVDRMGEQNTKILIDELDAYIASKGKRYSSHYATILTWARRKTQEMRSVKPKMI
ncbi:MAG: MarR family transcriptional regulator [Candidatus Pacebacteria bacterium]|nr:MarR family transcriptional regulator [Candidatus Paceibacterota bacterium]